ncbi:MAG: DUF3368 domain-containing protein [Chlorobi bacterium]|nr:DUF3368 domain-containing protein [Chlorobiota bacterium]
MPKIVISDTSTLILFHKIEHCDLLRKVYKKLFTTPEIANEFEDPLLLLDDLKARKLANRLNLRITGTLGVIHKAKQMGIIDKVKPLIDRLLETDFRISKTIINEILKLNKENASR